jgi:uncharacterized metal-binding protein YceD (DUF177 family)
MQRFEIQNGATGDAGVVWLACSRCGWGAHVALDLTLAELVQRAGEHTEVCR